MWKNIEHIAGRVTDLQLLIKSQMSLNHCSGNCHVVHRLVAKPMRHIGLVFLRNIPGYILITSLKISGNTKFSS
jgi:hypothetical protein